MSVFTVENYIVRAEKKSEFDVLLEEFRSFKETHPELFEGLRSWKLFRQEYGSICGLYIEMWEYNSLGDMDTINNRIFSNENMRRIDQEFHQLIEPTSFSASIWRQII